MTRFIYNTLFGDGLFFEKRQFMVVISNPMTWDVKCVTPGCTWCVHGHMPLWQNRLKYALTEALVFH